MRRSYFVLTMHSHLPYVHHPEHDFFLEERWFFEAVLECYIPILLSFEKMENDGVPFKVTMSLTPPLMEMMRDKDLQTKFAKHTEQLIELAQKEIKRASDVSERELALFYRNRLQNALSYYERVGRDLVKAFVHYHKLGNVELITCNATHAFLPLLQSFPIGVKAQLKVGVENFTKHTGFKPKGIWLAECGYYPGLDEYLKDLDLEFFFADSHAIWYADERPKYDVYRPVITPNGVHVFGRDPESSEQIWSAFSGYPGDPRYREFYRDIGFDRELSYIRPYIDPSGVRVNTGIKYHRITGRNVPLEKKDIYNRAQALEAVKEHAKDFVAKKMRQVERLLTMMEEAPIIVAPFDSELFGHWWYEGPDFLEAFFREIANENFIKPVTASEAIAKCDSFQILSPAASSWGAGGYNDVWINGKNDWIYPHTHEILERMISLASNFKNESDTLKIRALNQMARELLLAQSSDWAFIMTTGTSVEYAVNRINTHVKRFLELERGLLVDNIDEKYLQAVERADSIFPEIDFRVFSEA